MSVHCHKDGGVAVTMITVMTMMTMMTMMTLDGKSDDYDEKLFGGEKKRNPSANLFYLWFRCQIY